MRHWTPGSSLRHRKAMRLGPSVRFGTLDRLFSKFIRLRDRVCQRCGKAGGRLEAAHMFSRTRKSVRFDPENVYALCGGPNAAACHRYFDTHETEKHAWLKARLGETRYALLALRAHTPKKPDTAAIGLWLRAELDKLEGADVA